MKVFGFAGFSGSGKTTLIEQLIPRLAGRGLRVSLIKHAHHAFDIDKPGKDSYRHREAGATEVLITSAHRWVLMHELRGDVEPTLQQQLALLAPCDLALVEGYKRAAIPKLEVYRPAAASRCCTPATRTSSRWRPTHRWVTSLPVLDLNDYDSIAAFVLDHLHLSR